MTDKKLTDKEIIKALEEILELVLCEGDLQRASTISHTVDLINRLQTKNDRLEHQLETLCFTLKTAKAEAYKEFAEMLIDKAKNGVIQICDLPDYVIEMVGEDNG